MAERGTLGGVGRLIAFIVFVAVLVPGGLLARAWSLAAGRRVVAAVAVQFVEPTPEGTEALLHQVRHGRRMRRLGLLLGIAAAAGSVAAFAGASVFLWLPAVAAGLLIGVLLGEATRSRPRWSLSAPPRRPRRSEQISPWLLWTMRAVVAAELVAVAELRSASDLGGFLTALALVPPLLGWVLAEVALLRALIRPLPAVGADVPVDEALRTWTAHLVTAATSVLALLPLGTLLLVAGVELADRVLAGPDLLPVALVAAGFCGLVTGLAVAGFLLAWLRPVRSGARALAG